MRILKLEISNLFSYKKAKLDFTKYKGLVLIKGRNNAGKSALIRTISYVFFDNLIEGRVGDDIIRRGEDIGFASLTFKVGKIKYRIERGRKKNKAFCIFKNLTKNKSLTERKKEGTNKKIVEVIGMDFNIFRNSIMFGQGDVSRFVHLKDSGRKEIFCSLISKLREIDEEYKVIHEASNKKEDELNELLLSIGFPDQTEKGIKISEERMIGLVKVIKKYKKKVKQLEGKIHVEESKGYKKIKKKLRAVADDIDFFEHGVEPVPSYKEKIRGFKDGIKDIKQSIKRAKKGKCGKCKQKLPKRIIDEHIEEYKEEIKKEEKKIDEYEGYCEESEEYKDQLSKSKKEEKFLKKKLKKVGVTEFAERKKNFKKYKSLTLKLSEAQADRIYKKQSLREEKKKLKKQNRIQSKVKKLEVEVRSLSILEVALGNKGIRQDIIDDLIPVFEEKIKYYLRQLTDGIQIKLSTTVKAKSIDKEIDRFTIFVYSGKNRVNFELVGGGVKKVIQIAISFALSEFALEQNGTKTDFILLDEMFGELDSIARDNLIKLLNNMQKRFKNIIIISHIPEVQDLIKNQIEVVQENGVSRII